MHSTTKKFKYAGSGFCAVAPGADKTSQFIASLIVACLLAGCLGAEPDPEPAKEEEEPTYREEVEHDSASWEVLFMVWPWATDPMINGSSSGNVVGSGWHTLANIERPQGMQNATFVLEWEGALDPAPFEQGEFVIGADVVGGPVIWRSVDGTSPLNLTINEDDWPTRPARLHFRPHDPDTSIAFYTWIQWSLDMTFTKLILEPEQKEEERGRGSNDPGG